MDNAQDAHRIEGGGRLFSILPPKRRITKHSGSVCNGGKLTGFINKPKKRQLRKLDAVVEDNLSNRKRRMGCVGSDVEDGNRKGNSSCNTVYHASVPRKLRSAIRKRSNESISPPLVSKKLKHVAVGDEMLRKDALVKSNLNKAQAEVCVKDATLGLITKDEVEVAEALYALAVVFPDVANTDKKKLVDKQSGASSSALQRAEDSISRFKETEILKTDVEPNRIHDKDDNPKCLPNVPDQAKQVILPSLNGNEQPDISVGKQPVRESGPHIPEVNLPLMAFVSENECTIQRHREFVVSSAWTDLSLKHGSKLLKPGKSPAGCNHPEIALEPTEAASSQAEVKCITEANRDTGSSLWPGLSSRMSSDHERSCSAKHPAWFKGSSSLARSPISDSVVAKKDAEVFTDSKKSWKRCSTHVYIGRFIKVSQITDGRDKSPLQHGQITTNEGQKQGPNNTSSVPAWVRNSLIGSISKKSAGCSAPEKDATEVRNAILLHQRLVQDQQQCSTTSGIRNAPKQSLDILSLPSGSRVETVNSSNKPGQSPEALTTLPFPCLESQYQQTVPFPVSQTYYTSRPFSGYPSAAAVQQVHLPAFVGSMSPTVLANAPTSSQPEHRQLKKWTPLLMAHYKSGVPSPNVPNWQSGLSDLPPMFHQAQILFSPSQSSVEAIGSKYAPMMQQQQQQQQQQQCVPAAKALPASTVKGQYHHLPSIYEGNVGGTRPAYADNLQSAYLRC